MIFHSSACFQHDPAHEFDGSTTRSYPEKPERLQAILQAVEAQLWKIQAPSEWDRSHIEKIHDAEYLDFIASIPADIDPVAPTMINVGGELRENHSFYAKLGNFFFDPSTPLTKSTRVAATSAVDCVLSMAQSLITGEHRSASLGRPPGHHARQHQGGGYCIFNNIAIAAQYLVVKGKSVSILDLDYHHGNGTQEIFYDRDDVQYVSIHADTISNYPFYWGFADQEGEGLGKGYTVNLPVSNVISEKDYLDKVDQALNAVDDYNADIVLVSMGFDCHVEDPIAGLSLDSSSYQRIGEKLQQIDTLGIVLEGGYAINQLGDSFVNLYGALEE